MEKKELKWYEAPAVEVVEMKTAGSMLVGSVIEGGDPAEGGAGDELM